MKPFWTAFTASLGWELGGIVAGLLRLAIVAALIAAALYFGRALYLAGIITL